MFRKCDKFTLLWVGYTLFIDYERDIPAGTMLSHKDTFPVDCYAPEA